MIGINLKILPHQEQRYDTCGDWWIDEEGVWQIRVSKMADWRYEFLVFFHEVAEMAWCNINRVSEEAVSAFDIEFEKQRQDMIDAGNGASVEHLEPGDATLAPYYWGHQIATALERTAAFMLGVRWQVYEEAIEDLEYVKDAE